MKSVIVATVLLFLGGTTLAADTDTCQWKCSKLNGTDGTGNYTGKTSVVIEIEAGVDIVFDITYKIFATINTHHNLVFATNGKFILIWNIKTGYYILIDVKTGYAVYAEVTVDFLSANGSINFTKFIIQINTLLVQYTSITSSTSGAFNFTLIIVAFYSSQFDLTAIVGQQIAAILQKHFSVWFLLIQRQIRSGTITISRGIWGFIAVIITVKEDITIALSITEIISLSITYYKSIQTRLIVLLIERIRINIKAVTTLASKLTAIISVVGSSVSVEELIQYATSSQYNAVTYQITIGSITYIVVAYNIKQSYVIRFTLTQSSKSSVAFEIIYTNNVLFINNLQTNIVLALQGRSIVLANRTTDTVLVVGFSGILVTTTKYTVKSDTTLSTSIKNENWVSAAAEVSALIKENNSSGKTIKLQTLITAVTSNNTKRLATLLGSTQLATSFSVSFRGYFLSFGSGSASFSSFISALFGSQLKNNAIVKLIVQGIAAIAASGEAYSTFLKSFLKGCHSSGSVKIGLTST